MLGVQAQQHDGFLLPVCCSSLFGYFLGVLEKFEKLFACDRLTMLRCPLCVAVPGKISFKEREVKATNVKTTGVLIAPIFVVG